VSKIQSFLALLVPILLVASPVAAQTITLVGPTGTSGDLVNLSLQDSGVNSSNIGLLNAANIWSNANNTFLGLTATSLSLGGSTSGNTVLKAPAVAGTNTAFTLPPNTGTSGYVLQTDGSGNTSWVAQSGGGGSFTAGGDLGGTSTSQQVLYAGKAAGNVDYLQFSGAASGVSPTITPVGSTNEGISFPMLGTGSVNISGGATDNVLLNLTSTYTSTSFQITNSASGGHQYQFSATNSPQAFTVYDNTSGNVVMEGSGRVVSVLQNGVYAWNGGVTYASTSYDTGLSRISAGIVGVGNGTQGNLSGAIEANQFDNAVATITYSATPALLATNGLQTITLSGNAAPTITGLSAGQRVTFEICQNSTGGYTWTWPAAVHGGMTIGTTASTCSIQSFDSFNGTTLVAENAGISGVAP